MFNQLQAKGLGVCDDKQENCYADDLSAADLVYYIDEKRIFIFIVRRFLKLPNLVIRKKTHIYFINTSNLNFIYTGGP